MDEDLLLATKELADHLYIIGEEQLSKDLMTVYDTGEYSGFMRVA